MTLCSRDGITIGTWNVRTLRPDGRVEELIHTMKIQRWNILGLCEVRWKNCGQTSTTEGHKIYYSGSEVKHEEGVGFLIHKNTLHAVIECRPISSRLMTIRLKAVPFNITIIQAYVPPKAWEKENIKSFFDKLQDLLNQAPEKDIIVLQGDWNARIGHGDYREWQGTCGQYCNSVTNSRGRELLTFLRSNDLIVVNTFGEHDESNRWTWHHPNGRDHFQIDYIMIQNRFKSTVNFAKTRSFPEADIGSDHDPVMMTLEQLENVRIIFDTEKLKEQVGTVRIIFDTEKLKDPTIKANFKAEIHKLLETLPSDNQDTDIDFLVNEFNSAVTKTAADVLGIHEQSKTSWVTKDVLELCDKCRKRIASKQKGLNKKVNGIMNKAKGNWIENQCKEIEDNLKKNNTKKAYQMIKDLAYTKKGRSATIQHRSKNYLIEDKEILKGWTEYCTDFYSHKATGKHEGVLCIPIATDEAKYPILRSEVEAALKSLKKYKSPGIDNIPAELLQEGGDTMIDILLAICNKIWRTGTWPTIWTQSLVIPIYKKGNGNQQLCHNYRIISLISHPSKVMLKVILNRLKPQAEDIISEEQAGLITSRSTTEQIFSLKLLCEKYLHHQQDLYSVYIDVENAFDRVCHAALWETMKFYNIDENLISVIKNLYEKVTSAVYVNNTIGDWFQPKVGIRQGCPLSPTILNIFLARIMTDALHRHKGTVKIGGMTITNLRFADKIVCVAGNQQELASLMVSLEDSFMCYGMQISAEKAQFMTYSRDSTSKVITVGERTFSTVQRFKYLGAFITDNGSEADISARILLTTEALIKLEFIWNDKNITLKSKIRLLQSLVFSKFLYACESWTLGADSEEKIKNLETKCLRKLSDISKTKHDQVIAEIKTAIKTYKDLLTTVKQRKLMWFGKVSRSTGLAKVFLQGTVRGSRPRGRQRILWVDDIKVWTDRPIHQAIRNAENREEWKNLADKASGESGQSQ